ncbi:MAG: hypothetical protein ACXAD7_10205 [Candidatus Kariarchaeaceae archaeon]
MEKAIDIEKDFIRLLEDEEKEHEPIKETSGAKLLFIGKSKTSNDLSRSITNEIQCEKLIHVIDAVDAINEMAADKFSVVIIDNDADNVDPVNVSKIVRINNPLARVVVISENLSENFLASLINQGSIDTLLPMPIDDFTAYQVIVEQHAKHEISFMLNEIILNPPKYSPAYFLQSDPTLLPNIKGKESEIIGCVISHQSVTRYSKFFKEILINDEYLLSGYISAMTMLGQQLFQRGKNIREINFGGISVFFHLENELQFSFFVHNLTKSNYDKTEELIGEIVMDIVYLSGLELSSTTSMDSEEIERITKIIYDKLVARNQIKSKAELEKPLMLTYGVQYLITSVVLNSLHEDFSNYSVENEEDALVYLFENDVDVLIVTPIRSDKVSRLSFAAKIKERLPKMQIIGIMDKFKSEHLIEVINSNSVDMVLSNDYWIDEFRSVLKSAADKAKTMKTGTMALRNQKFLFSYDQSLIARTLLKDSRADYEMIKTPEFHALIISRDELPFYSKYWQHGGVKIELDELMFSGFIASISSFSREMFISTEPYAGITFGDASLIILNYFDISFAFFVVNVDQSNYPLVHKHIETTVFMLYNLIVNTKVDDLDDWDPELPIKIEQMATELFLKFASISLT